MKKNIWNFLHSKINEDQTLILLIVVESKGSAPGRKGFKMTLSEDGQMFGTIGGGKIEFDLIEYSKSLLKQNKNVIELKHFVHNKSDSDSSGMICGGSQDVAIITINKTHSSIISQIELSEKDSNSKKISINSKDFTIGETEKGSPKFYFKKDENYWEYSEKVGLKEKVYIVGAGHVGIATANLLNRLNFETVLLDNRGDLNLAEINQNEIKFTEIENYSSVNKYIEFGYNSYVVIVTFEHSGDQEALKALIDKDLKYLGMMGSRRKIKEIKDNLLRSGLKEQDFEKVHSPIGVNIKSESPDEIAISIAAEIIDVKNRN